MKLTISSTEFGKALSIAAQAAGTRATLPVLGNLLLEAGDGALGSTPARILISGRRHIRRVAITHGRDHGVLRDTPPEPCRGTAYAGRSWDSRAGLAAREWVDRSKSA
jgi:hypothetical protein